MAGVKGRIGGARPCAGRKPSEKTIFLREFVGPMPIKRPRKYATDAEREAAKKEVQRRRDAKRAPALAEKRARDRAVQGRAKYERKVRHELVCGRCGAVFLSKLITAKYCGAACRSAASNSSDRRAEYLAKKYKECPKYNLRLRVRSRLAKAVRGFGWSKSARTEEMLGCSYEYLVQHIERQFLPGMNWENRDAWHVDHIVPLASAKTLDELEGLNHFTNLRPMWAEDNLSKGAKVLTLL